MSSEWEEALRRAYAANKQRGQGPTSQRQLAIALGDELRWKRNLNRIKNSDTAAEATAAAISSALQRPRSELPATGRPTVRDLESRLEVIAAALEALLLGQQEGLQQVAENQKQLAENQRGLLAAIESLRSHLDDLPSTGRSFPRRRQGNAER